jgi:hypothetical protein
MYSAQKAQISGPGLKISTKKLEHANSTGTFIFPQKYHYTTIARRTKVEV